MGVFNRHELLVDWVKRYLSFSSFEELSVLALKEICVTQRGSRLANGLDFKTENSTAEHGGSHFRDEDQRLELRPKETVAVSVSSDMTFEYKFKVASAAQRNLLEIVQLEMARVTPFTRENSFCYFSVTNCEIEAGMLQVCVFVVRRDVFAPVLSQVEHAGAMCVATFVRDSDGQPIPYALNPAGNPFYASEIVKLWKVAAASTVIAFVALGMVFVSAVIGQRNALATIESASQVLQPDTQIVREAISARQATFDADRTLHVEQTSSARRISVLEELSRILPTDAFLVSLEIQADQGSAEGFATAPESLISALEGSTAMVNVRFSAPVIKTANETKSSFAIKFNLRNADAK